MYNLAPRLMRFSAAALALPQDEYAACLAMARRFGPGAYVSVDAAGQPVVQNGTDDHRAYLRLFGRGFAEYRRHPHGWLPAE